MLSLASQCSIITILHLHNTILHKSATPYVASCKEITIGLNLISVRDSWRHSTGGKKYCSSQHLNPCLELPPLPKTNIMRMKAQTPKFNCHIFFLLLLRSLSCSSCCYSFLLVLCCQMGFILKFKCFTLWQYCPLSTYSMPALISSKSNAWHILKLFKDQALGT